MSDQTELQVLNSAIDAFFSANPTLTPDLRNLTALLNDVATSVSAQAVLQQWFATLSGANVSVFYSDMIADAQTFTNPTIPAPAGNASITIDAFTCSANGSGTVQLTAAAVGTAGGGTFDSFTVFFTKDGVTLFTPKTLVCGSWSSSGGLGQCTKLSISGDPTTVVPPTPTTTPCR